MKEIRHLPTAFSYSSAVIAGDYVFLGLHRGFGPDFKTQLASVFGGLEKTLSQCGLGLERLVKVHVWLKNVKDLPAMEKLFNGFFEKDGFPARMTATTQFIDDDCLLMIEGTAWRGRR